jgi:acetyl-CoA C-acetyltransferase
MSNVRIIGSWHGRFGQFAETDPASGRRRDLQSFYELLVEAGRGAIQDAGLEPAGIEAVYVGSCSPALFVNQEHPAPAAAAIDDSLRFKPMTRVEGACASSTLAFYQALYAIEAGRCRTALVIGVEKMSLLDTEGVAHALACSSYYPEEGARGMTFPGLFAELAKAYQAFYRLPEGEFRRMLAAVSALGYRNGADNPLAQFGPGGKPARMGLFTPESILALPTEGQGANLMVAPPLRLHDCSLISDGAAALVLAAPSGPTGPPGRSVRIAGIGHAVEHLPLSRRRALHLPEAGRAARDRAFGESGIRLEDVDLAEVHDCFSINHLLCTEALGLSAYGRAGYDYLEGRFTREDRCPVNLSGGLKAKGHPVGATGASMHVLLHRQLIGEPIGAAPKKQPGIGVLLNVGGSGVTNCVTVLARE